jgi:shikimate kinase
MNLVLCGMMGAGKTTVGEKLAQKLGWSCCDTDHRIEEKYGKITKIFAQYGEEYFRGLETQLVKEFVQEDGLVVSVGGGLVLRAENVALLKQSGKIIFLRAKQATLVERLVSDDSRPLLQSEETLPDRIHRLLVERMPTYEKVADFIVDVDGKTPEEIAEEIIQNI